MAGLLLWTGIAAWMLAASVGLALHDRRHPSPETAAVVPLLSWTAGLVLLTGAVAARRGGEAVPSALLRLLLVAAVAAPRFRYDGPAVWKYGLSLLPALALAAMGLVWLTWAVRAPGMPDGEMGSLLSPVLLGGGLGGWVVGESLAALVTPSDERARSPDGVFSPPYLVLTVLTGGLVLAAMVRYGRPGGTSGAESGLAGAWLTWSAARLLSAQRAAWVRPALVGLAGLILVAVAVLGG